MDAKNPISSHPVATAAVCGVFGAGVMAGIVRARRQDGTATNALGEWAKQWRGTTPVSTTPVEFSPVRHAFKAFVLGTALCLSVSGVAALVIAKATNVGSLQEGADKLKVWAPAKRRQLEKWLGVKPNAALEAERRRMSNMTYDEEMDHWSQVLAAESEADQPVDDKKL